DLGIGYLFEKNPQIEFSMLYYDTFELMVSPDHPLAKHTHTTIDALKDVPFIMLTPDTAGRRFVDQVFQKFGIVPQTVMELSSSEEVKRMVELNMGVAIISKLSIANELKMGTLKMIKVDDLEIMHPVGVMYKAGRYLNAAMRQFLRDLQGMPETTFLGTE
ncbi:MAG TPA: LysR family transcriptional regulator substrate-binding protein, partial [Bacilli bacterium]